MVDAREAAVRQIAHRRHRAFRIYACVMGAVNALIVAFWAVLAVAGRLDMVTVYIWPNQPPLPAGFFWPIFPIAICGVLVLLSWRRAYPRDGYPDDEAEREIARHPSSEVRRGGRAEPGRSTSAPSLTPAETGKMAPRPSAARSTVGARRRGLAVHVLVYLVINTVLVAAWALVGGGFFWPVFLMTVWGAGVLVNAYLAYRPHSFGGSNEAGSGVSR